MEAVQPSSKGIIVSGFPGVGKTILFNNPGGLTILDSDSSKFSWIDKAKGERHPKWPKNYVDHIVANRDKADLLLVSSHKETRDALVESGVGFSLVYPSLEMRQEYIDRYIKRGSNAQFVKLLEANYEKWIQELMMQQKCKHVLLQPGQYLSDVIDLIVAKNQKT